MGTRIYNLMMRSPRSSGDFLCRENGRHRWTLPYRQALRVLKYISFSLSVCLSVCLGFWSILCFCNSLGVCSVSCLSVLSLVFMFCLLSLFPSSFFFISCFLLIVLPFDLYLYGSVLFIFCLNFHLSLPAVSSPSIAHFTLNSYIVISS